MLFKMWSCFFLIMDYDVSTNDDAIILYILAI